MHGGLLSACYIMQYANTVFIIWADLKQYRVICSLCRISVTYVDKEGKDHKVMVPVGKNLLEAAHDNEIDLEGASAVWLNKYYSLRARTAKLNFVAL